MSKADETKSRIIETAARLVASKGYAATSTKEIAEASQVAEGTIFKYFTSKENLLQVIMTSVIAHLKKETWETLVVHLNNQPNMSTYEKLSLLFDDRQAFFNKHKVVMTIMLHEVTVNKTVQDLIGKSIMPEIASVLRGIIEEGKRRGELKDLPTETMVIGFINLVLAPFLLHSLYHKDLEDRTHRELFEIYCLGIREIGHE